MEVTASILIDEAGDAFVDADSVVDAQGNRFVAVGASIPGQGNSTDIRVIKYTPAGVQTDVATVTPTDNYKLDKVTITHTGADLLLTLVTHEISSSKPRGIHVESALIQGVFQTSGGLDAQEGGANAWSGDDGGQLPGGGGGVTAEEVQAIVDPAKAAILAAIDSAMHTEINNLLTKMAIALDTAKVLTLDNVYHSDGLYQRFKDTTKEECTKALVDYGVAKEQH